MNNQEIYLYNPISKNDDAVKVWFSFPFTYSIGMSSLGYLSLYRILDENPNVEPERIFTDTSKTKHKLHEVDLFGFSFSFEFDFLKIFEILDKYKIPFNSSERDDSHPLIFAGGPVLSANPEPFADIFDFIIIGDGEDIINEISNKIYELKDKSSKEEILTQLSQISGVYVPKFYKLNYEDKSFKSIESVNEEVPKTLEKRTLSKLVSCNYTPILTGDTYFSNSMLVEISRGCPQKCGFCLASYLNMPTRFSDIETIKQVIKAGLKHTDKIGLLGALIAAHPKFNDLCQYLLELRKEKEFNVSVSSLRADKITPLVVKMLTECGQKSATIAIEAGSERLRKVINKNLSTQQIFESVKTMRENGLSAIKIYAMIGLPTETDQDIAELIGLMKELKKNNPRFNITLSISSFVPKAQTPFQWLGREDNKSLDKKNNLLKKELHKLGIKFKPTSVKWDCIQAVLSRGDRRLFPILEKVYEFGGSLGSWNRAYKEIANKNANIPSYKTISTQNLPDDTPLPWEHICSGIDKDKLLKEKLKLIP